MSFLLRLLHGMFPELRSVKDTAAFEASPIDFGDKVRVIANPLTESYGVAGRVGTVYGQTTPSVSGVEVMGSAESDYAVNVSFEDPTADFWFSQELLELVDRSPGMTVTINGVSKKWIRNASGDWEEHTT
jgi:hypothetical protein